MKRLFTIMAVVIITARVFAQPPQKMSYQAVIRDVGGTLLQSHAVGMRIQILQTSEFGAAVYVETHSASTNANGLVTLEIGSGNVVLGTFATINWANGPYFLKTETDPTGGTNYTITGTSQLLSVPYALHANTAASYPETDPTVKAINGIIKSNGTTISTATAGTDYLTPTGSAALLTNFPILNQNTTGNAATVTTNANLTGDVTSTGNATIIANKKTMTATAPVSVTGNPKVIASGAVAISIAAATPSTAGSMSAADKTKLDGIATSTHIIGESYGGGIIFYLDASGEHGLIAATSDQSTAVVWTNPAFASTVSNAVRDGINGGLANTERIILQAGAGSYAAQLCANYKGGNYADWYLPSKYELNLMYMNIGQGNLLGLGNVGGFANNYYWSSTEYNNSLFAWVQSFNDGLQSAGGKNYSLYVRAVRAF